MAIKPKCDRCGEELKKFGGVLLGPPDKRNMVKKFHLCQSCYKVVARQCLSKRESAAIRKGLREGAMAQRVQNPI